MGRFRRRNLRAFYRTLLTKALLFTTALFVGHAASGQSYELDVNPSVSNDSLFVEFRISNSGIPDLNFGGASFSILVDTNGLDMANDVLYVPGRWSLDSSSCFEDVTLNNVGDTAVTLSILRDFPGAGCTATSQAIQSSQSALVGIWAVPITNCQNTIRIRDNSTIDVHLSWNGQDLQADLGFAYSVSVNAPVAGVPLNPIGSFGFATSDTTLCPGDVFDMYVTGVDTSLGLTYEFYHFDADASSTNLLSTQLGGDTLYTTVLSDGIEGGDSVYVVVSDGGCSDISAVVEVIAGSVSTPVLSTPGGVTSGCDNPNIEVFHGPIAVGTTVQWLYSGVRRPGLDNTLPYVANHNGVVSAVTISPDGCRDTTNAIAFDILPSPSVVMDTIFGSTVLCGGDSVGFQVKDIAGNFLEVDGGGDMTLPDDPTLNFTAAQNFTIELVVAFTGNSTMGVLGKGGGATFRGYNLFVSAGNIRADLGNGTASVSLDGGFVGDGDFHRISLTVNRQDSLAILYVDGEEEDRVVDVALTGDMTTTGPVRIGSDAGGVNFFNGIIDDVRFWSAAFDEDGIDQSAGVILKGDEPFLITYHDFEDTGFVPNVPDVAATGNTGVLNGTASIGLDGGFFEPAVAPIYSWSQGGTSIPGTDEPVFYATTAGDFAVEVSNDVCTVASASQTVISSAPSITMPSDTSVCLGATFNYTESALTGYTYVWKDLSGDTLSQVAAVSFTLSQDTSLILTKDTSGCSVTDTLNIAALEVLITALPDSGACVNDTITYNGNSNTGVTNTWSDLGGNFALTTTDLDLIVLTDTTLILTVDSAGCSNADTALVSAITVPQVVLGNDTSICVNETFTKAAFGSTDYNYTWTSGGSTVATTDTLQIVITSDASYIAVLDSGGCSSTDTIAVTAVTIPLTPLPDTTVCGNETIVLVESTSTDYTYSWTDLGGNFTIANDSLTLSVSQDSTIILRKDSALCSAFDTIQVSLTPFMATAIPDTGNCVGTSVTLNGNANLGVTNTWSDLGGTFSTTTTNLNLTILVDSVIILQVDSGSCTASDTAQITAITLPVVDLGNDTTLCLNDTLTKVAFGSTNYNYTWTTLGGATVASTDTVNIPVLADESYIAVLDSGGCSTQDTIVVSTATVPLTPVADVSACAGSNVALTEDNDANFTYTWTDIGGNFTIVDDTLNLTLTNDSLIVLQKDSGGCEAFDTIAVTLGGTTADLGPDLFNCSGDVVTLYGNLNGGGVVNTWDEIGGSFATVTADSLQLVFTTDTTIVLSVDSLGCTASDTISIRLSGGLVFDLPEDTSLCSGDVWSESVTSLVGHTYSWRDGQGTLISVTNTISFTVTRDSLITLEVDSAGLCPSFDTIQINTTDLTINLPSDTTVCQGSVVSLKGNVSAGVTNTWTDLVGNPFTTDSIFTYTATSDRAIRLTVDSASCSATDIIDVFVINSLPPVDTALVVEVSADSIAFYWPPVSGVTYYEIAYVQNGVTQVAQWDSAGTDTTYGIGGFTPGFDTLVFEYRAVSSCDTVQSGTTNYILGTCDSIGAVTDSVQLSTLSSTNLDFVWNPVANALSYSIQIDTNGVAFLPWTDVGLATTYSLGGLNGDTVTISFSANGNCDSVYSDTVTYIAFDCNSGWTGIDTTKIYCSSSFSEVLSPDDPNMPDPGFFEGPGVNFADTLWYFDPQDAGPGIHTVSFIACYGTDTTSYDSVLVQAAPCIEIVDTTDIIVPINEPQAIYTDCDGQIYFSDNIENTLVRVDTFGNASIAAGVGSGTFGFTDGHIDTALFNSIFGIIVHPTTGVIYISDAANHAVRAIDPVAETMSTVAGGGNNVNTGLDGLPGDSDDPSDPDGVANTIFTNPWGLAFNGTFDTLYVADNGNSKIKAIALSDNSVRTVAGTGLAGAVDGPLLTGTIADPAQIKFDPSTSRLYIGTSSASGSIRFADFSADSLKTFNANAFIELRDGPIGTNPLADGTHNQPIDIAPDGQGNLFVLDQGFCALRKVSGETDSITTIVGNVGGSIFTPGSLCGEETFADRLAGDYLMDNPSALTVFVNGFVDIVDTDNQRLLRVAIEDFLNSPLGGLDSNYCVDADSVILNPITVAGAYSSEPSGFISIRDGNWVFDPSVDTGTVVINFSHQIGSCAGTEQFEVRINPLPTIDLGPDTTMCAANFGSQTLVADTGWTAYQWYFSAPSASTFTTLAGEISNVLAMDTLGSYVLEVFNEFGCNQFDTITVTATPNVLPEIIGDTVMCFGDTINLSVINNGAGPGFFSYDWNTGDTTSTTDATFSGNFEVTVIDSAGCVGQDLLYVARRNKPVVCINVVDTSFKSISGAQYNEWEVGTLAGLPLDNGASDIPANGLDARFNSPWEVFFDDGDLYVTESGRIRRINLVDTLVTTFVGDVAGAVSDSGDSRLRTFVGNAKGFIKHPETGIFYYVDDHHISEIRNDSVFVIAGNSFTGNQNGVGRDVLFEDPQEIDFGPFGEIMYIAGGFDATIRTLNLSTNEVQTYIGVFGDGRVIEGDATTARVSFPWGVEVTNQGELVVAHEFGDLMTKISIDTVQEIITSNSFFSGTASTPGYEGTPVGEKVLSDDAQLFNPWNMVEDDEGRIFFTEGINSLVRVILPDDSVMTIAGNIATGSAGLGNADGLGKNASFRNPTGITRDPSTGMLYVTDRNNHTIRTISQNKAIAVCPFTPVDLNGTCSNAASYRWLDTTGAVLATGATYTATDSGVYYLEVTSADGCVNTDSIVVTWQETPSLVASPDTSICVGDTIDITALGDTNFTSLQWTYLETGTNLDTLATIMVSDTGNYMITATDSNGCILTDTATITQRATVFTDVDLIPAGPYCFGDTVLAIIPDTIRNDPGYAYTLWQDSSIADTHVVRGEGIYAAYVVTTDGCVTEVLDTAEYDFLPEPAISTASRTNNSFISTFITGLSTPIDIVEASNGDFFVSDLSDHQILRFSPDGTSSVFAGSGVAGLFDGAAGTARFDQPTGLAIDQYDNVYVADAGNHVIRKITPSGEVSTYAGTGVAGYNDGPASSAQFNTPTDIAITATGFMVITDRGTGIVRTMDMVNKEVATIGLPGGSSRVDGSFPLARFDFPTSAYAHPAGPVVIGEQAAVRFLDFATDSVQTFDEGTTGTLNFTGVVRGITSNGAPVIGFTVDTENWFIISSGETDNVKAAGIAPPGTGFVDGPVDSALFNSPFGVLYTSDDRILIVDALNGAIREYHDSTSAYVCEGDSILLSPESGGTYAWAGPNSFTSTSQNIFVQDSGTYVLEFTETATGCVAYDSIHVSELPLPVVNIDTTIASTGGPDTLLICEGDTALLIANPVPTGFRYRWRALGDTTVLSTDSSFQVATEGQFSLDVMDSVTLCSNLDTITIQFFTDTLALGADYRMCANECSILDAGPGYVSYLWSDSSTAQTLQICAGGVFDVEAVTSNGCTVRDTIDVQIDFVPEIIFAPAERAHIATIAGDGNIALVNSTDPLLASFNSPTDVAVDSRGVIYIADEENDVIRKIDTTGEVTSFIILPKPSAMVVDKNDNLFVALFDSSVIIKVDPLGSGSLYAGAGGTGFRDGFADTAQFFHPFGMAIDESNNIYLADAANHAVRRIDGKTRIVTSIGDPGTAVNAAGTFATATFNHPSEITVDANGDLYVTTGGGVITVGNSILKLDVRNETVTTFNAAGNNENYVTVNGMTDDWHGNVYFSMGQPFISKIDASTGISNTLIGGGTATVTDGLDTDASVHQPSGLFFDAATNSIYNVDALGHRVRVIKDSSEIAVCTGDSISITATLAAGNTGTFAWDNGATGQRPLFPDLVCML